MNQFQNLIPEIKEWQSVNGQKFDVDDWIAIEGNIKLAIGYSSIYWPDFIEYEDCVFLKSHFSLDGFNQWRNVDYVKYFSQIEYVINHIHILDLFAPENQQEITKDQIIYLGEILREIYETKLTAQFENRQFTVTFNGKEEVNELIDYELSFHQQINETRKTSNGS
ncbi:MAG: hypothetical protein ACHQFX_16270 [Chitinophagales bacterium]